MKYNADGLRVQKTVNGVVTNYTLHGKNIVHLTQGSNTLHFWYDASGKPAVVEWNDDATTAKYAYIHNLQGDIVGCVNRGGMICVLTVFAGCDIIQATDFSFAAS